MSGTFVNIGSLSRYNGEIAALSRALAQSVFAGAAAVYSTRIPQGSTYSDPLLRVRRSLDNAEQDIYASVVADANGNRWLDTTALLAFCGAGNGFVTVWYDQSVNGRDISQGNTARQPQIVASGVYNGEINFAAAGTPNTGILSFSSLLTLPFPFSTNTVARKTATNAAVFLGNNSANSQNLRVDGLTSAQFVPGTAYGSTFNASVACVLTQTNGPATTAATGWFNGSSVGSTSSATSVLGLANGLGAWTSGVSFFAMKEFTVFTSAISTNSRQNLERNQGAAFGITVV